MAQYGLDSRTWQAGDDIKQPTNIEVQIDR